MSTSTAIQWTDVTDNIIVVEGGGWWCRMISPGCAHCYAAKLNQSEFFGGNKLPYSGDPPKLKLREDILAGWKRQTKPKRHFVASMTDIFGEWVPQEWADKFLDAMCVQGQTFQLLTKRPDVMRDRIASWVKSRGHHSLPRNIWLGVSVEDQKRADERIPILLSIPAKVRFLSVEPMLGPVDWRFNVALHVDSRHALPKAGDIGRYLHWVIFGGESGSNARPCNIDWIRDGVKQCREAGVKAFVKQLGSLPVVGENLRYPLEPGQWLALEHPKGGDMNEFPHDLRVREFPTV